MLYIYVKILILIPIKSFSAGLLLAKDLCSILYMYLELSFGYNCIVNCYLRSYTSKFDYLSIISNSVYFYMNDLLCNSK